MTPPLSGTVSARAHQVGNAAVGEQISCPGQRGAGGQDVSLEGIGQGLIDDPGQGRRYSCFAVASSATGAMTDDPVPYVALAVPTSVQPCPYKAACEGRPARPGPASYQVSAGHRSSSRSPDRTPQQWALRWPGPEDIEQITAPVQRSDVVQQRAGGVAGLTEVLSAAGQPPDQPRVDGSDSYVPNQHPFGKLSNNHRIFGAENIASTGSPVRACTSCRS